MGTMSRWASAAAAASAAKMSQSPESADRSVKLASDAASATAMVPTRKA